MNKGIEIIREFLDANGDPLTRATVGQEFLVRLRMRATDRDRVPQVAVVDLLPGGVEPVTELQLPADTSAAGVDPALMRRRAAVARCRSASRNDRTGFRIMSTCAKTAWCSTARSRETRGRLSTACRATNAGTFQVPPAFAEGMYNRTLTGLSLAGKLEVVKP